MTHRRPTPHLLLLGVAALALAPGLARADAAPAPTAAADGDAAETAGAIVVTAKATRSTSSIAGAEIQKILPGAAPFKAIETLPGVFYVTADPWGNNEQNAQLFIHGFSISQLGYVLDGVPLGDQNYGNFNGLSPQRATISENVGSTVVATGAGELGIASTSNLGGAVQIFSSDPAAHMGAQINQTVGMYGTSRTYARIDTGEFAGGNKLTISADRQRARSWDFNGIQGGWQANAKFVHEDATGKLTGYFDWSDKTEPNEDATVIVVKPTTAAQSYTPYTRPYTFPSYSAAHSYVDAFGNTPASDGSNYRNYYSDAHRADYLGYLKYDLNLGSKVKWSNQVYYHHNNGEGVVAGPLGQSITVVDAYLTPGYTPATAQKSNANNSAYLVQATGGSGYVTRTTEYRIMREGIISTLNADLGAHQIEVGAWYQYNSSHAWRRWYALDASNVAGSTPYITPTNPLFTQYAAEMRVNTLQLHLQDTWKLTPALTVEGGLKTSAQYANGWFAVQPKVGSLAGFAAGTNLPAGRINTENWFLPTIGAKWDATGHEQLYFNIQKNMRQYQAYGGGGSADPWSTSSQAAFDFIKANGHPETSWTYEVGLRSKHSFTGLLSSIEGQLNYYHVDFSNRLLAVSAAPGGIAGGSITGGTTSLFNVGSVKTNGVDAGITARFGQNVSIYNATSFNSSTYSSDYSTATGSATGTSIGGFATVNNVVPTGGKQVPGSPKWMNKTVITLSKGPIEAQFFGDYVGKRYATYVNDGAVGSYFLVSARVAAQLPAEMFHMRKAELSINVTNLGNTKGVSTLSVNTSASYSVYPIAPRMVFGTLSLGF
ncbi:MAG: TonB-dependent receptor [Sphingomonadales bacterium]|nr:TonB-dependent receptor [Sphingomonadales bacterium]MDE2168462.1 TonB-dependent receptor [Sphingomonadales bacterium]